MCANIPRSPISLFVACSPEMHAETKITMLRMFYDCIDLASPESDGWQVHDWLKRAYAIEKVPISQNSITWLLHLTANERYVECSPPTVWSALQYSVRSVLNHERHSGHIERILQLSDNETQKISQRHLSALRSWIALRVTGRALLPMALYVGSFLQLKGFDWTEDYMPHAQFLQAQPNLYTAWCHAVLDAVERLEDYMREELDSCMRQLGWTRHDLLSALADTNSSSYDANDQRSHAQICSRCQYDYGIMAHSLVEPAQIAIQGCIGTGHDSDCRCRNIFKDSGLAAKIPEYTGVWGDDDYGENESDIGEEFFDAQPYLFDTQSQSDCDVFTNVATLLYSAQGRIWIGSYAIDERLCATCFLFKEQYIGEDGFAAEFPAMPQSFESLRTW
jgi:hypothetical protein